MVVLSVLPVPGVSGGVLGTRTGTSTSTTVGTSIRRSTINTSCKKNNKMKGNYHEINQGWVLHIRCFIKMTEKRALKFFAKWLILSKSDAKQRNRVFNPSQVTYLQKITLSMRKIKKVKFIQPVFFEKRSRNWFNSVLLISTVG